MLTHHSLTLFLEIQSTQYNLKQAIKHTSSCRLYYNESHGLPSSIQLDQTTLVHTQLQYTHKRNHGVISRLRESE